MKTLEVRLATEADLPALHALFAAALPEVWSMEALLGELQYPYGCLLVALQEGTLVGFADARFVYGDGELTNIAVSSQCRRSGVGTALMEAIFSHARAANTECITLEVRAKNTTAQAFYEQLGFVEIGRRPSFYDHPVDDALLYQKKMEG